MTTNTQTTPAELAALIDRFEAADDVSGRLALALEHASPEGKPAVAVVRHGKVYAAFEGVVMVRRLMELGE